MIDFESDLFSQKAVLNMHLAYAMIDALKKDLDREVIVDCGSGRKVLKARDVLALGLCLRDFFVQHFPEDRVGVVLPPGIPGLLVNFGLLLADKRPVNLNFTAPVDSIIDSQKKAGIKSIISIHAFKEKYPHFPWGEGFWDVVDYLKKLSKKRLLRYYFWAYMPLGMISYCFRIPFYGGHKEAILLFTSGSSANAKGVVLSHKNLLANTLQIYESGILPNKERLMGCLPLFHSFGLTVTVLYPLLYPICVVTTLSPLEIKKIAHIIDQEKVTAHLGTPTFFKPYLKTVDPSLLKSLKGVVAGAEKSPDGLVGDWETTFHSPYLQGYGLTETSPVVSVNLPDLPGCIRRKLGSVGRLFHGMAARIVCPESFKPLPIGQVGLLELKGANIFREYLNDRVSSERSFEGQWFKTHDLARLDADGFLYIEGRLSRFSKIGGEMVSHHRIEDLLHRFFPSESGVIHFVVMGVEDVQKGERLVVLTSQSIDLESIRGVLNPHLPNMWIPRECICVPAIPLLASGKLDLKACAALIQ